MVHSLGHMSVLADFQMLYMEQTISIAIDIHLLAVKTDISEALDCETWRRYLLKQCKEQISPLSAGKQVTNRMIS